jgi:hypothetical protein
METLNKANRNCLLLGDLIKYTTDGKHPRIVATAASFI